jgi:hypothetical protein
MRTAASLVLIVHGGILLQLSAPSVRDSEVKSVASCGIFRFLPYLRVNPAFRSYCSLSRTGIQGSFLMMRSPVAISTALIIAAGRVGSAFVG